MFQRSKGFTNIELILTVGIISVLSSVVYFVYGNTNDKRQVASEIENVALLVNKITSANNASSYANLSKQKLVDMGIYYQSEFKDFDIQGLSPQSFKISYNLISGRMCNDLAMKTVSLKGEYSVSRTINGNDTSLNPLNIAAECDNNQNKLELVFNGLNVQNIVSVTPGTPKPPPVYAGEATWEPDFPDRGDVPTNLDSSGKSVNNPGKPIPGTYTPPTYVVAGTPNPGGGATNPGSFVRPEYIPNNPLGPLVNPPDSGNEWVPAVPPVPPRPPATGPDYSVGQSFQKNFNAYANPFYSYSSDINYRWMPNLASPAEKAEMFATSNYQEKRNIGSTYTIKEPGWGELRPAIPGFFGWDGSNPQTCVTYYWRADYSQIDVPLRNGYFVMTTSDYEKVTYIIHRCVARGGGS